MKKKVLVTGADGFIGSHLVERLVREGREVKAFVYYNSFNSWGWLDEVSSELRGQFEVFTGDIRDPHGVSTALEGCDSVMHLAALIGIPFSYHSPHSYVDTNVKGTLNVLQAAREKELSRVLHTSTSEVYGTAQYTPIDENHPLRGQSPYSASKIGADQLAYSYYTSFRLPVTTVRPFNTYGPRQSCRAVIPTIITQIANGKKEIKLGSTTPTRDFNFVEDTVSGFLAVEKCQDVMGEVINLASNFDISIGDTAKMISQLMGEDIKILSDEERFRPENSEVQRLWGCNQKVLSHTDWKPQYSGQEGFKRGLEKTIEWFKNPENLKKFKDDIYNV